MKTNQRNKRMTVQQRSKVIDESQATLSPETINKLTNAVTQAKSNLHGDTKLQRERPS